MPNAGTFRTITIAGAMVSSELIALYAFYDTFLSTWLCNHSALLVGDMVNESQTNKDWRILSKVFW